jgi:hypothetical protein
VPEEINQQEKARTDFLIAMYNQLMNDINRHIIVIWQSVGVLFGAFAVFALVEKGTISFDFAATLVVVLCIWVIAHVYDASYWYNRNLVIIANIERQFLRQSDLREIHYYFGAHRRGDAMITHLELQRNLAIGIAILVLLIEFSNITLPILRNEKCGSFQNLLPWLGALLLFVVWLWAREKSRRRIETFLQNSPGKPMDTTGIEHGPGHPV